MGERLLVIGGDAAGMSGASQARRMVSEDDLDIVAFERGRYTSFSACGIPYFLGGVVQDVDELVVRTPEQFHERGIDARIAHEVVDLDLRTQRATVVDLASGRATDEPFDRLLVATGAVPIRPPLEGSDARGIYGLQVLDDGVAVRRAVEERRPRSAVVVGAGYIGLEVAEALTRLGLSVTVVEMAPQPLPSLDPDMGALVADAMRAMGIDVRTGSLVTGFETTAGAVTAVATDDDTFPADLVVLGLGARPNVELAERAGLEIGPARAIGVDDHMATSVRQVWAAGDCAEKRHRVTGRKVAIPLGTHANKEGRIAGINIAGGDVTFPGVVGTAVTQVCDLEIARTGIKEVEAAAEGFSARSVTIESRTRAGYYPNSESIRVKLVFDEATGRLLGGQIVGREGAAKRIDVLATALWNEMAVGEVMNLDLGYAPPFSPVWDPVLIAARKAVEQLS